MHTISGLLSLHQRALDAAGAVLDQVRPADLSRSTPCIGWDLRMLLGHVIGQNFGFALAVEASSAPATAYAVRPFEPGGVAAAWRASAERVAAAFAAAPTDRTVLLVELSGEARFPVSAAVGIHLLDTVVHTWDVATALGQAYRPADELVSATLARARQIPDGPARRSPTAAFAAALPLDATDDWNDTLALLGRR